MFGKKTVKKKEYDQESLRPILRCSICTGEQVVFEMYGIDTVTKEY